jgi:hypothetical protein
MTLTMFGEEFKLWGFSLCNFLYPLITSALLGQNILFRILFLNTLNIVLVILTYVKQEVWVYKFSNAISPTCLD